MCLSIFFNSVSLLAHYVSVNIPLIEHIKCSCNLSTAPYLHSFKHTSSVWDINYSPTREAYLDTD